jgi:murein DD-endopeptidase MepM/ murein hydrolase activator NlpD
MNMNALPDRISAGVAGAVLLVLLSCSTLPGLAADVATPPPSRGIAVLASDIGKDYPVEALADFVQKGNFSPVVVDWAWVTAHFDETDFDAVNRFIGILAARGVEVAAMYRPRFLNQATVAIQVTRDGKPASSHGQYICFSNAEARKWGQSWGEKILGRCPGFSEIIIYNPLNQCECPTCLAAREKDPYAHYAAVWTFLKEARAAWQARKPGVKLGVVFVTDPEFWKRGRDIVDAARPFLFITDDTNMEQDMAAARGVREIVGDKMRACLAKITWGPTDKVSPEKLATFDRLARQNSLPYFLWTFDTAFLSNLYDAGAASQALGLDYAALKEPLSQMKGTVSTGAAGASAVGSVGAQAGSGFYTDEQLNATSPDILFQCIQRPQPGYNRYAALNGLTRKAKISDAATVDSIVGQAIENLKGRTPDTFDLRMQCCMLLGDVGDERGVAALAQALLGDPAVGVRMAAAGALGKFESQAAVLALQQGARREREAHVRNSIAQALSGKFRPAAPGSVSTAGLQREPEVYVKDASQLPPARLAVTPKRLPWPFPGGFSEQHIFNNYQQPTDIYIHAGLDFIQPADTPVTAVDSGYVAAIYTNYPEWGNTHYFFIVTPQKGGSEGWCYTHMDPTTYTFKVGDYVTQGQTLGKIVKFSVGDKPGVDHLHLHYVRFERTADGKVEAHSLLDPLLFFEYQDTVAPLILAPFHFVRDGTLEEFPVGDDGEVTVNGKVDVIVGMADGAADTGCNWGVPVVTFSITGPVPYALQKLVLDHRGDVGDEKQTRPLYLSYEEKKRYLENPDGFPRYHFLRITKTDGDGLIEPADALQTWDTTASGADGKRIWPDGKYTVRVYAWDLAGNRSMAEAVVRVRNR